MTSYADRALPEFPDCPDGREDCRFSKWHVYPVTLLGWTPEYDRSGRILNRDPNPQLVDWYCGICRRKWTASYRQGEDPEWSQPR